MCFDKLLQPIFANFKIRTMKVQINMKEGTNERKEEKMGKRN